MDASKWSTEVWNTPFLVQFYWNEKGAENIVPIWALMEMKFNHSISLRLFVEVWKVFPLIVHGLIEGKLSLETTFFSKRLLVVSLSSELQNQTLLVIANSPEICAARGI